MKGLCGANCEECEYYNKKCKGCKNRLLDKKCWIADYIELGSKNNYEELKKVLISEINSLNIDGMSKINELYPLHGSYVNMEYPLPNGKMVKLLNDEDIYLGNQVECEFNDNEVKKCFGILANMSFILVCEYEENGINPEIIIYKKR